MMLILMFTFKAHGYELIMTRLYPTYMRWTTDGLTKRLRIFELKSIRQLGSNRKHNASHSAASKESIKTTSKCYLIVKKRREQCFVKCIYTETSRLYM